RDLRSTPPRRGRARGRRRLHTRGLRRPVSRGRAPVPRRAAARHGIESAVSALGTSDVGARARDDRRRIDGAAFDEALLERLPATVDPCAERGEFHTCATGGPMFGAPIGIISGEAVEREGFLYGDLCLAPDAAR